MLDIKVILNDIEAAKANLTNKKANVDWDRLVSLDAKRKEFIKEVETLQAERNSNSAKIGQMKRNKEDTSALEELTKSIGDKIKTLTDEQNAINEELDKIMLSIPNMLLADVPVGKDENENVVHRVHGEPRKFDFTPLDHAEVGSKVGIFDFERGAKLSGARFTVLKTNGAKLVRGLARFMLEHNEARGYTEMGVPYMVSRKTLTGTGQLPKFEEDLFFMERDDLFLIPTAEVPLTNLHSDEILNESDFPIKYTALTPCFRREAGSYGKDTKGFIRQHQFDKVELVEIAKPEDSLQALEYMVETSEGILQKLGLPYRVVRLCSGDTGFSSAKTYDIEVWIPSQNTYREISSCSTCTDFQARRANIRYKASASGDKKAKTSFVHTLNGSSLAVGRTLVAIIENYQRKDGSIEIPEALRSYVGFSELK